MNIHISNLSFNVLDSDLRKLFAPHGMIESAAVVRDRFNGRSKGVGLVEMVHDWEGSRAVAVLNQTVVDGKTITVRQVRFGVNEEMY